MKKSSTVAQKMRWTAGVLYLVLSLYQIAVANTIIMQAGPGNSFVWTAAVLLVPAAAAMAVWMFSGNNVFGAGARRGVVVATIVAVVFELLTYSQQVQVINYTLSALSFTQGLANNNYALYALVIVRLLLLILAAFFVTSVRDSYDYTSEKKSKDGDDAPAPAPAAAVSGTAAAAADLDKPLNVPRKEEPRKDDKPGDKPAE